MDTLKLMAMTPAAVVDPSIAIAACRAGVMGTLDLEFCKDLRLAVAGIDRLVQYTGDAFQTKPSHAGMFGIKIGIHNDDLLTMIESRRSANDWNRLDWIVLAGGVDPQLTERVKRCRQLGIRVFLEVVNLQEAILAFELKVDGLILKGHESGGRIGEETAFVLMQHWQQYALNAGVSLPVWVQGGIGLNSAAGVLAGGAQGVVLDSQLLLTRESPLNQRAKMLLAAFDSSHTRQVGAVLESSYRIYQRPGTTIYDELVEEAQRIADSDTATSARNAKWFDLLSERLHQDGSETLFLGQDAELARSLADRYVTVGGVVQAIIEHAAKNLLLARELQPLAPAAPLAESHGTKYPILQGPMTRVSDTAEFANAVAIAGGLPFLALALLRGPETKQLLRETAELLGEKPWGAGILGFLPTEIRQEQTREILARKPPFAIIAGGRPDQAKQFEDEGIATYLHVPSPGLLRMFLKDGANRFIFEGRECGGHVGPRSSFLLWEAMVQTLLDHLGPTGRGDSLHIVFAGGIHDAVSASVVAAIAAPLAQRGVKIGVLMGTAYLFTQEAVDSGAIVPRFQQEAVAAEHTVLLETGPGHAIRCLKTPYFKVFEQEKLRLRNEGKSHEEIVKALEWMNIGRLRVASKGLDRDSNSDTPRLMTISDAEQYARGMYMIGQIATLRNATTSMADLHEDVCCGGANRLENIELPVVVQIPSESCDVAIIGMSGFYPGAVNITEYWENILRKEYAVTEIPATHWDWSLFYDENPRAKDRIISKWGGFLKDVPFDPLTYGITPNSLKSIEPLQLLALESVRFALDDAGYSQRPFNRERTCAVLGIGGGGSPTAVAYGFRACLPMLDSIEDFPLKSEELRKYTDPRLPEWTEDSFPGMLMNVTVGRVANRFNFGGANYAVDAACASSLAAVHCCIRELQLGTADVAVAMGADTVMTPYGYMAFSKTHALSPQGRCRPFDAAADGIVLSEGVGAVILKRLADAQRDGDRIYAVIRGVASSSDGREKGLTAPNTAGQLRAIRWAYEQAGTSPARAGLIEAHGTGTVVGDRTEAQSISQVMQEAGAPRQSCAIGSVKSMIGHTKCAAGVAGLIKTTLALHRKVLPPTLAETPNPTANFQQTSLYLNGDARPWVHGGDEPRLAGVSAFGFGGTNTHLVVEEYTGDCVQSSPPAMMNWPSELFVWRRESREELVAALRYCEHSLAGGAAPALNELAASVWKSNSDVVSTSPVVAIVATSLAELREKISVALPATNSPDTRHSDPRGVFFAPSPKADCGQVAFLCPGQGSQYVDMLGQLAMNFHEVRETLDSAERLLRDELPRPLGKYIYPPTSFTEVDTQQNQQALADTEVAQPAIGAVTLAMAKLLTRFGVKPAMVAGHSYGEYTALAVAGALSETDCLKLSYRRGHHIRVATNDQTAHGGMIAVAADGAAVEQVVKSIAGITMANLNAPNQTVISGSDAALESAAKSLQNTGLKFQRLQVAAAFHSPLVAPAAEPLSEDLRKVQFLPPSIPVFSNVTASKHSDQPDMIRDTLAQHLTSPVRFVEEIQAMYEAGARVFIEIGPLAVLTGLTQRILEGKQHLAVSLDQKHREGLTQLQHALAQLLIHGVDVQIGELFAVRDVPTFDLRKMSPLMGKPQYSKSTWIVNGIRSRPLNGPEPLLLGQSIAATKSPQASPAVELETKQQAVTLVPVIRTTASEQSPTLSPHNTTSTTRNPEPQRMNQPVEHPKQLSTPRVPDSNINANVAPNSRRSTEAGTADVMQGFQQLMGKFLDTQRAVMLSYLGQSPSEIAPFENMPERMPASTSSNSRTSGKAMSNLASGVATTNGNGHAHYPQPRASVTSAAAKGSRFNGAPPQINAEELALTKSEPVPAGNGLSMESMSEKLLELVSDRTGYPPDMLDLDLDLEADLGIDSIKRVEILGGLAEAISGDVEGDIQSKLELEKLTSIRNLRGILEYLRKALIDLPENTTVDNVPTAKSPESPPREVNPSGSHSADIGSANLAAAPVQRALVTLGDSPLPSGAGITIPSGAVLLTDDGRGIARAVALRLSDFGQQTILVRMKRDSTASWLDDNQDILVGDLTDSKSVAKLVALAKDRVGTIAGLIHLLPLASCELNESWANRAKQDVKSLYLLAKLLGSELCEVGRDGSAVLLAATSLGGGLGFSKNLPRELQPGHGGVLGFMKCVGMEWPDVLVRAVDFDPQQDADEVADYLLGELGDSSGPLEVGYLSGDRVTWQPVDSPLNESRKPAIKLDADSTILLTGGARGITAEIALELAQRFRCRLALLGRSPMPELQETTETANLNSPAEIKAALIAKLKSQGRAAATADIESMYHRLRGDREIRYTLQRIREAGSHVIYLTADVRDETQMEAAIRKVEQEFGKIDGVIHGAGVIEDKLLRDKTPESFDRVFSTKVDSAYLLSTLLDPQRLKFCVFFASIASRYGNRGQSDYAAANEVLSKLAASLDRQWPARVFAVAWGPWADVGMVSDLAKHLSARGVTLIAPRLGAKMLVDELLLGVKGETEVLIAGGAENVSRPKHSGEKAVVSI